MRTIVALAVFLTFAVSTFGQAVQRPQQPQTPQQRQSPILRPRARVMPIPNWPADKPAPVIPIPTQINPQSNLVNRDLHLAVPVISLRPSVSKVDGDVKMPATKGDPPAASKP